MCWLATHVGIFIPQKWLGPGLLANVLVEKLGTVRIGDSWVIGAHPPSRSIVSDKHAMAIYVWITSSCDDVYRELVRIQLRRIKQEAH